MKTIYKAKIKKEGNFLVTERDAESERKKIIFGLVEKNRLIDWLFFWKTIYLHLPLLTSNKPKERKGYKWF